ncbi:AlpA family phage regulatory protein [Hydrogenophaga sp. PAMC20947]|nr:AlpA family phage regulatory protein [Hydrogenophaga sp. PAMC20947]
MEYAPAHQPTAHHGVQPYGCSDFSAAGAVTRLTGLGRSSIYRLVTEDRFPSPVKLSSRAVGWRRDVSRGARFRGPASAALLPGAIAACHLAGLCMASHCRP